MLTRLVFLGLSLGAFYALVALGFSLVFGVTRVFNLAYGELILLGAYVAYWTVKSGGSLSLAFPLSVLLLLAAGWLMAHLGRRLREPYVLNSLLATLGLAIVLQNMFHGLWGGDYHVLNLPSLSRGVGLGPVWVSRGRLLVMAASAGLVLATHAFMNRTRTGWKIRATIQDREAALLSGIDIRRTALLANLLGASLVGVAGPLLATVHYVYPQAGRDITLLAIMVTILVGVGNTGAVIAGGIFLGMAETMTTYYLGGEWQEPLVAVALLGLLLLRPTGILAGEGERS